MASDVTSRLLQLIAEVLELDPSHVQPESHFFDDLGASSLDIAEMVWRIEDDAAFDAGEIPDDVLDKLRRVQDVIDFIEGRRRGDVSEPEALQRVEIALASDHAGVELKAFLKRHLQGQDVSLRDMGPSTADAVDYPDFAEALARLVARGEARLGVLICGTGVGMSIAANKVRGVRAACVQDPVSARLSREHNDANVLCLGSRIVGLEIARACVDAFVQTTFVPGRDGRHRRRVGRIHAIEQSRSDG